MVSCPLSLKHKILLESCAGDRRHSFSSLASRYGIRGGERTIQRWHTQWDGTPISLERRRGQGRKAILTPKQVQQNITKPIRRANQDHVAIHYTDLVDTLRKETHQNVSVRTVQRYGKKNEGVRHSATKKRTEQECKNISPYLITISPFSTCTYNIFPNARFFLVFSVSAKACLDIARIRRVIISQSKSRILFLDETHLRIGAARRTTLVAPGESQVIVVDDTATYAPRYDMIACVSGDRVFPPMIFSPEDKEEWGQSGVSKEMVLYYIEHLLAQAAGSLDLFPLSLIVDKSTSHHPQEMLQVFHDNGCQDMQTIWLMPTNSAKRMSPLDNTLVHQWKEAIRKRGPMTKKNIVQVMADEWNKISANTLRTHYRHCGLLHGIDPYFDCPNPSAHQHHNA